MKLLKKASDAIVDTENYRFYEELINRTTIQFERKKIQNRKMC